MYIVLTLSLYFESLWFRPKPIMGQFWFFEKFREDNYRGFSLVKKK